MGRAARLKFQDITSYFLLLVAHWLECDVPAYWPMFNSWHVPYRDSYYKGKPDPAAATHQVFLYFMLRILLALNLSNRW